MGRRAGGEEKVPELDELMLGPFLSYVRDEDYDEPCDQRCLECIHPDCPNKKNRNFGTFRRKSIQGLVPLRDKPRKPRLRAPVVEPPTPPSELVQEKSERVQRLEAMMDVHDILLRNIERRLRLGDTPKDLHDAGFSYDAIGTTMRTMLVNPDVKIILDGKEY